MRADRFITAVGQLRAENPAAADLAVLCSLAARVEPGLLRRLRLLLPGADVSAESDLHHSGLLAGRSVAGIALEPEVAELLRAELRLPRWDGLRARAGELVEVSHADLHWSLRLEEQIYSATVETSPPASPELLLLAAIRQLGDTVPPPGPERNQQLGVARWLRSALARLPASIASGEVASAAGLAADLRLDNRSPSATDQVVQDRWLPWLFGTSAPTTSVALRFSAGRLEVNAVGTDTVFIEVPVTEPLVLDLVHSDGRRTRVERIRFTDGQNLVHAVGSDTVDLTTLAGAVFRLSTARRAAQSGGLDFASERLRFRPCLGADELVEAISDELRIPEQWAVIGGEAGTGKTTIACAVIERLDRAGYVILEHFFDVDPAWNDVDVVAASLDGQLRSRVRVGDSSSSGGSKVPSSGTDAVPTLAATLSYATGALGRHIAILLDNVPGDSPAAVGQWLSTLVRDRWPAECHAVIATRHDLGLTDQLPSSGPIRPWIVSNSSIAICQAMLDVAAEQLSAVLGSYSSESLLQLAAGNPLRLRRIIDWLCTRGTRTEGLAEIPPTLTTEIDQLWERFASIYPFDIQHSTAAVAVARPGFTVDDLRRLASPEDDHRVSRYLALAAETKLIELSGPISEGVSEITAAPRLAEAVTDRFGTDSPAFGHDTILGAIALTPVWSLSAYQLRNAAFHTVNGGGSAQAEACRQLVRTAAFLHARAMLDGVSVVLDDLISVSPTGDPLVRAARAVESFAQNRPDRFVEAIANELRRVEESASLIGTFSRESWEPTLTVRVIERPAAPRPAQSFDLAVTAAVGDVMWTADGVRWLGRSLRGTDSSARLNVPDLVAADAATAVSAGRSMPTRDDGSTREVLMIVDRVSGSIETLDLPGAASALRVSDDRITIGTRDGTILLVSGKAARIVGRLVGHTAAITAVAEVRSGTVVSASADGTVRIWDLGTERPTVVLRHRAGVRRLMWRDGLVFTVDLDDRMQWWDAAVGAPVGVPLGAVGPVSQLIAVGAGVVIVGADGSLTYSAVTDGAVVTEQWMSNGSPIVLAAGSDIDRRFTTYDRAGRLRWWDDATVYAEIHPQSPGTPLSMHVDALSRQVTLVHSDGVQIWDLPRQAGGVPVVGGVRLAVSDNGAIAVADHGTLWTRLHGDAEWVDDLSVTTGSRALSFAYSGDLLRVDAEGSLTVERTASINLRAVKAKIRLMVMTGDVLVHVSGDGVNPIVGRSVVNVEAEPPTGEVGRLSGVGATALAVLTGGTVAVGDERGALHLFAADGVDWVETILHLSQAPITSILEHHSGTVVGDATGSILRVDPAGRIHEVGRHDDGVTGLVLASEYVVSSSYDRTLRLWDADRGAEVGLLTAPSDFVALASHPEPGRVIAATADGAVWTVDATEAQHVDAPFSLGPPEPTVQVHPSASGRGPLDFSLTFPLSVAADCELRAVGLHRTGHAEDGLLRLVLGTDDRFAEVLTSDGRLALPRRLNAGQVVAVRATGERPDDVFSESYTVTLILTVSSRTNPIEARYRIECDVARGARVGRREVNSVDKSDGGYGNPLAESEPVDFISNFRVLDFDSSTES